MWKWIEGYEGKYKISDRGEVFSMAINSIMKQQETCGYKDVNLGKNGKYKKYRVHRLVAIAFVENPENKPHVNHLDEDRKNNHSNNLEWVTPLENANYGNRNKNISNHSGTKIIAKKEDEEILFNSLTEAEKSGIGVTIRGISAVLHGHQHTHRGYKFKVIGENNDTATSSRNKD